MQLFWNNVAMVVSFGLWLGSGCLNFRFWSVVPKKGRIHVLVIDIVLIYWFDWILLCSASDHQT